MMEALKRFLSPEYLVVAQPGPLGVLWVVYVALGIVFAGGLAMALLVLCASSNGGRPEWRTWAWLELWVCLAGLGVVVGRFLGWPGWSARIWPLSLAILAVSGMVLYRFRHLSPPNWLVAQLRILALNPPSSSEGDAPMAKADPSGLWLILGLLIHLAGVSLVLATRTRWPLWTAPLVLLAILLPQVPLLPRRPHLMALTPLLAAYAVTLLWLLYCRLGLTVIGWQGLAFPNPMVSLFYVDGIILGALAATLLCQLSIMSSALGRPSLLWRWAVMGLLVLTLGWASVVYLGKRTAGATASDPYAYAQMGVDLAERGTFMHRFPLFQQVMPLEIAWAPLQPVGYHIPRNELGDCPSVWATGASALLAAGYWLMGEDGLYVTTPIVAILALAATWALVHEILEGSSKSVRHLTAAVTITLLATSPEYVDRLLVPMADAPAQLFTVLTALFAVRGMHRLEKGQGANASFLLAGVCFASAYWVRHPQLVLGLPVVLALVLGSRTTTAHRSSGNLRSSAILWPLLSFLGAAALTALPDVSYRWRVFGGPFATETTELPLMGVQHVGPVAWIMLRDALAAGEWGYLLPLLLYGAFRLIKDRRTEALVLGSALFAVVLVHLTYRSLRLRDLISVFPFLDLAVAYGAVTLIRRARADSLAERSAARLGTTLLPALVISWAVLGLALSRWVMVGRLWQPGWASFGYVTREQRAALEKLRELTPPDSIIGASLNAGAVMMYTGRDAIRPYDSWTEGEWNIFLKAMQARGRPIYLLDDGRLMADFIQRDQVRHVLTPIAELEVPLFYARNRESGWLFRLEWEG